MPNWACRAKSVLCLHGKGGHTPSTTFLGQPSETMETFFMLATGGCAEAEGDGAADAGCAALHATKGRRVIGDPEDACEALVDACFICIGMRWSARAVPA